MANVLALKSTLLKSFLFSSLLFFVTAYNHHSIAQVTIQADGATTFCEGGSVTLSAVTQTTATAQNPGGGGATGDCNCPAGYVVVGIQGRTGSWIDQYSLICQQLNSAGALFGPLVVTTPNGTSNGGAAAGPYMLLPAGKVMVGGVVQYHQESSGFLGLTKTNYLLSIGLRGQSPSYVLANSNNSTSPATATTLEGSENSNGTSTTWVPNGNVVTGMRSFNLDTYSAGVQWIYSPIKQVMTDYLWMPGGETTKSITVSTSGTYTLTTTAGSLSGSNSKTVTVNATPAAPSSFSTSSENVCRNTGVSYNYSVPAVAGATSYIWSYSGNGESYTNGTTNSVGMKFSNSGSSGTLSVKATNSCGTSTALTMYITVSNGKPNTPGAFTTTTSPVCQGQSNAVYTVPAVTGTSGAFYYIWSYGGTGVTIDGNSNSITADFSNTATAGKFSVTAANACGNNAARASNTITINALPAQPGDFTTQTTAVCQSKSGVSYVVPTTSGANTYAWSYSGDGATINGNTKSVTVDFGPNATSGTLSVAGVSTSCGTGTPRTTAITVNDLPVISQITTPGLLVNYKLNGNANDATGNNQGTLQNSPTSVSDRFGNANSAYSFNGTSQYISTALTYNDPNFTLSLWFKTTTNAGGKLIGIGASQTGASTQYDRHVYMANNGQVYFGVYPGGAKTVNSTTSYNDGKWHMVTVSLATVNGMKLYIDGELVANDPSTTTSEGYIGYLRIAYDNLDGWPETPSSRYFNGSLDDILIYSSELTPPEVTTLYNSPDGAGNNGPLCIGSTLNLSATTVASSTYSWTGPNSFSSSSQNPSLSYTTAYAGTYTLTVTKSGCSAKAYTNVITNSTTPGLWTGNSSNSWQTAGNWCGGVLPSSATNVTIPVVTNLPVNNGTASVKNITINPLATLTNIATGVLNVSGDWTNNGIYTDNGIYSSTGKVSFTGTGAQAINGATTFNNLTIDNTSGAGVTLNSPATVNGVLTLNRGTFTTNNNLTQNLYTGAISGSGNGSTTGNIVFNKTVWGDKYHYMSAPVAGLTAADWNDNVTIKFGANSNLYTYNEAVPDTNKKVGWVAVPSISTPLQSMQGYALYFPRFIYNTMVDVTGAYTHNAAFSTGTLTNTRSSIPVFKAASDGWQLVGNPYPSNLNWDAASGWTKSGIDGAYYTWDARRNKYVSYAGGGVGTNGGNQYIGSMQAFFIKVSTSNGTGSLAVNNNARSTASLQDVWRAANDNKILRLKIANGDNDDETVIRFTTQASENFDASLDAYKLLNDGQVPSLFSLSADADYSINSLPGNLSSKTIPLQLNVMTDGEHSWNADLSGFDSNESFFLEDRLLDTSYNLTENPVLTMSLTKGEKMGRFFLRYAKETVVTGEQEPINSFSGIEISAREQNILLLFTDANTGTADIAVFDAVGKKVYANDHVAISAGRMEIPLPNANTGIYIVKAQTSASAKTQQVFIQK